jgi:hypothetical protein
VDAGRRSVPAGLGGAFTSAVILSMIVTLFPEPRDMAKAIGVYAFVASAGGAAGLLVGGILTQAINWHWIFFVNLPIGIATAVLTTRVIPRDQGTGLRNGADVAGALLITGAMRLSVFTIVKPAAEDGWLAGRTSRSPPCRSRCWSASCCGSGPPGTRSAAALVLFSQAPVGGGYASHILPVTLLMGTGVGLAFPALMTIAMTGVTPAEAG